MLLPLDHRQSRHKTLTQFCSILTACIFFLQSFAPVPSLAAVFLVAQPQSVSHRISDQEVPISIPSSLGVVSDFQNSGGLLLVLIQDAHGIPDAQRQLAAILKYLEMNNGVRDVFVEGAIAGRVSRRQSRFFERESANRIFGDSLLERGIAGALYSYWMSAGMSVRAWGIEDPELYRKNLNQYRSVLKESKNERAMLDRAEELVVERIQRSGNRDWIHSVLADASNSEKERNLQAELRRLDKLMRDHLRIRLSEARYQFHFPNLVRYFRLMEAENTPVCRVVSRCDEKIKEENNELRNFLNQSGMPSLYQEYEQRVSEGSGDSALRSWSERFYELTSSSGFSFDQYPHAAERWKNAVLRTEIDARGLWDERNRILGHMAAKLSVSNKQKTLRRALRHLRLAQKMLALEMHREELAEFHRYQGRRWFPSGLEKNDFERAADFYRQAISRESAMARIMESIVKRQGIHTAALIAGGFHAGGIKEIAKARGWSYVSIVPRLASLRGKEIYAQNMLPGDDQSSVSQVPQPRVEALRLSLIEQIAGGTTAFRMRGELLSAARPILAHHSRRGPAWRIHGIIGRSFRKSSAIQNRRSELRSRQDVTREELERTYFSVKTRGNAAGKNPFVIASGLYGNKIYAAKGLPQPNVMIADLSRPSEIESFMIQNLFFEAILTGYQAKYAAAFKEYHQHKIKAEEGDAEAALHLPEKEAALNRVRIEAAEAGFEPYLTHRIPLLSRKSTILVKSKEDRDRVLKIIYYAVVGGETGEEIFGILKAAGYEGGDPAAIEKLAKEFDRQRNFTGKGDFLYGLSPDEILSRLSRIVNVYVLDEQAKPVTLHQGARTTFNKITISIRKGRYVIREAKHRWVINVADFHQGPSEFIIWNKIQRKKVESLIDWTRPRSTDKPEPLVMAFGTADPTPFSKEQDFTNMAVSYRSKLLLIDPSPSTVHNLMGLELMDRVAAIYMSHLHWDHLGGLTHYVYRALSGETKNLSKKKIPLIASRLVLHQLTEYVALHTQDLWKNRYSSFSDVMSSLFEIVAPDRIEQDREHFELSGDLKGLHLITKRTFGHPVPTFGFSLDGPTGRMTYLVDSVMPAPHIERRRRVNGTYEILKSPNPRYAEHVGFFGNADLLISENGVPGVHITPQQLTQAFPHLVETGALYTVHSGFLQNEQGLQRLEPFRILHIYKREDRMAAIEKISALLQQTKTIRRLWPLNDAIRLHFARVGRQEEFPQGTVIFKSGEAVKDNLAFYILLDGEVTVRGAKVGEEYRDVTLRRGDIVGEMGVLGKEVSQDLFQEEIRLMRAQGAETYSRGLIEKVYIWHGEGKDRKRVEHYIWKYEVTRKTVEEKFADDDLQRQAMLKMYDQAVYPPRRNTVEVVSERATLVKVDAHELVKILGHDAIANVERLEELPLAKLIAQEIEKRKREERKHRGDTEILTKAHVQEEERLEDLDRAGEILDLFRDVVKASVKVTEAAFSGQSELIEAMARLRDRATEAFENSLRSVSRVSVTNILIDHLRLLVAQGHLDAKSVSGDFPRPAGSFYPDLYLKILQRRDQLQGFIRHESGTDYQLEMRFLLDPAAIFRIKPLPGVDVDALQVSVKGKTVAWREMLDEIQRVYDLELRTRGTGEKYSYDPFVVWRTVRQRGYDGGDETYFTGVVDYGPLYEDIRPDAGGESDTSTLKRSELRVNSNARGQLIESYRPYYELLSESDDLTQNRPDVIVLLGNPDLRTFVEFAKIYKERYQGIPIVLSGGRGRGTVDFIKRTIAYYGDRMEPDDFVRLQDGISGPGVYETDVLAVILKNEGVMNPSDSSRHIHLEEGHSATTTENFRATAGVVEHLTSQISSPKIAIVTNPVLFKRAELLAHKEWKAQPFMAEKGARILRLKTYSHDMDKLTDQELLDLVTYSAGHAEPWVAKYPKLMSWKRGNEIKGFYDFSGTPAGQRPLLQLVEKVQLALEVFLNSREVDYDEAANRLLLSKPSEGVRSEMRFRTYRPAEASQVAVARMTYQILRPGLNPLRSSDRRLIDQVIPGFSLGQKPLSDDGMLDGLKSFSWEAGALGLFEKYLLRSSSTAAVQLFELPQEYPLDRLESLLHEMAPLFARHPHKILVLAAAPTIPGDLQRRIEDLYEGRVFLAGGVRNYGKFSADLSLGRFDKQHATLISRLLKKLRTFKGFETSVSMASLLPLLQVAAVEEMFELSQPSRLEDAGQYLIRSSSSRNEDRFKAELNLGFLVSGLTTPEEIRLALGDLLLFKRRKSVPGKWALWINPSRLDQIHTLMQALEAAASIQRAA